MPSWLRRVGSALLLILLLGVAHVPLAGARFTGGDFRTLVEARERPVRPWSLHGTEGHPLAALSLIASESAWSDPGPRGPWARASAAPMRIENLALLVIASFGLALFLRRLLWPWTGSEHATAAGWVAALLFALHPLHVASVASLDARGDLLALAAGTFACAAFLRSRQEHGSVLTVVSGVLAILAGLASDLALVLPFLLAVAEFASARRYRPSHVRLRTAATTFVVFAACVALDAAVRSVALGRLELPASLLALAPPREPDLFGRSLSVSVERLGALVLPVNAFALGAFGFAIAGGLVLLALQPALVAARSAPRLWGWLVLAWAVTLAATELASLRARVHPEDVTHAATLLASAAVVCAGLGTAATAVSGLRRTLAPLAIALGYALLAQGNARAWSESAAQVESLRRDLDTACETYGREARHLVLDPVRSVRGVDALDGALPWFLDPIFSEGGGSGAAPSVQALSSPAFLAFARESEFRELRKEALIVTLPSALLAPSAPQDRARASVLLAPPRPTEGTRSWFREGRSPQLDLEALSTRVLRVRTLEDADTSRPPVVSWRASGAIAHEGSHTGVWIATGEAPEASFDLSASLAWLLGDRIQKMWPAQGWSRIGEAQVQDELPRVPGEPELRASGEDWIFAAPTSGASWRELSTEGSSWKLGLLDFARFEYVERAGRISDAGELVFDGAAAEAARLLGADGGKLAWSLERRLGDVCVARTLGGRVERRGSATAPR